jgi:hypothetical protein
VTVEVTVETKAVVAVIEFDVTPAEAMNPVLQLAMREGFAEAVGGGGGGMLVRYVSIVEVAGQAVGGRSRGSNRSRSRSRQRHLQSSSPTKTEMKFEVASPEPDEKSIDKLNSDVKAAAAAGDIVATIIQKAASRSVLTPALAQMDTRVANLQTSVRATTANVVKSIARGTLFPTPSPTPTSIPRPSDGAGGGGGSSSGGLSNGAMISIGATAAVVMMAGLAIGCGSGCSGQESPPSSPVAPPVGFGSAEGALANVRGFAAQTRRTPC